MDSKMGLIDAEIRCDLRGWVKIMKVNKDYLLIFTKKGCKRGGEIHVGWQYNVLIEGQAYWTIGNEKILYKAPALILTPPHMPHMMESITDTLILEWRQYPLEDPVNYYEPFRKIILGKKK